MFIAPVSHDEFYDGFYIYIEKNFENEYVYTIIAPDNEEICSDTKSTFEHALNSARAFMDAVTKH